MSEAIKAVKQAIKAGDQARARKLLKPILQQAPSADAWTLAAMVTENDQQAVKCLKRALALDEWHSTANRMLYEIENVASASERGYQVDTGFQSELEQSQQKAKEQGQFLGNLFKGIGGMFRVDEPPKKKTDEDS